MALKRQVDFSNWDESDYEEENFSDPEGFVDDVDDEDILSDLLAQKPKESDVTQFVVIVDGLPTVEPDRLEKLTKLMKKLFKDYGNGTGIISIDFPTNANQTTKGFAVLEMKDKAAAEEAVRARNNHVLDKQHTLFCYILSDIHKYENVPEKFEAPERKKFQESGDLHYYLLEENCFDQFVVIHNPRNNGQGNKTSIYLNSMPESKVLEEKFCWTESAVRWSPLGSYLATFHAKGIAFWGREKFEQVQRFSHPGVRFIDFSPNEKYLVTYSPLDFHTKSEEPKSVCIFDVRTGVKKRGFHADQRGLAWPYLKWSFDDKFFARISPDCLSVYETPVCGLLDKKSVKIPGIQDFNWSPTENVVVYWVAENNDVPAKVSIMAVPSREEIRSKNLFNVAKCETIWQKNGDYLCVKVARYTKAKREKNEIKYSGIYYTLEIFHMREKGIPVDTIEIKENIVSFDWEPNGGKFGIISGEMPHINVTFYQVQKGIAPTELKKYEKKPVNAMLWSPQGQFVVLAGLRELQGYLEFIDTKEFQVMNTNEHFMVTDVEWDPTGRYVATIVSWFGRKVDNAYWLWTFQGRCLKKQPMDELFQFSWRPRPPSTLTNADMREIKKKMKKHTASFELQDQLRSSKASQDLIDERRSLMETWLSFRESFKTIYDEEKPTRVQLRGRDTDAGSAEDSEEVVEFLSKRERVAAG